MQYALERWGAIYNGERGPRGRMKRESAKAHNEISKSILSAPTSKACNGQLILSADAYQQVTTQITPDLCPDKLKGLRAVANDMTAV